MPSTGPSIRATCRILNANSCGSGSIVGTRNGKSLIMTNAHVAGTTIGRICTVDVEANGDRIQAKIIRAAYSNQTATDWALLETVNPYNAVQPVPMSRNMPSQGTSHYTKGFPNCNQHSGTDIFTIAASNIWEWAPISIPGQSGSAVWSDNDHLQYGLVTWHNGGNGLGQFTATIFDQMDNRHTNGAPRQTSWTECSSVPPDFDFSNVDKPDGLDDPVVSEGYFDDSPALPMGGSATPPVVEKLNIWDDGSFKIDANDKTPLDAQRLMVEYQRELAEFHARWKEKFRTGG